MVPTSSPYHSQAVLHIKHRSVLLSFCSTTDWLEDTGWVEALVQAKVVSAGTADSFLKASHITRTRHAHQVTANRLYILLKGLMSTTWSQNAKQKRLMTGVPEKISST